MLPASFLPFAQPDIASEEEAELLGCLRSGWLTTGAVTRQFESEFGSYVSAPCAVAVNSCTAGLHLALAALRIGPGDEVITTPLTFCATVNVILQAGATPVLADIGSDLNISPQAISGVITPRTCAIIPVHMAGLPCDMDAIWRISQQYSLKVIEDAAHGVGAVYKGGKIGAGKSDATAFSFYATKNMTTGEGGMMTTNSRELGERARLLSLHGIDRDALNRYGEGGNWYYDVVECGFKYNMSDLMAALGIHQLRKLDRMNACRADIAATYNQAFSEIAEVDLPPDRPDSVHAWHLYVLRLNLDKLSIDRAGFFEQMRSRGIGCSVHFIPIPKHSYYRRTLNMPDPCARALIEYPRLLSLPLYSKMTESDVSRVVSAVREIVYRFKTQTTVLCRSESFAG